MLFIGTFKSYGILLHFDDEFISIVAYYAILANIFGRVFWGYLIDFCNPFKTLCLLSFANAICLYYYFDVSVDSRMYFGLFTIFVFCCHGGNMTVFMPITIACFGNQHISNNYGCIYFLFSIFNIGTMLLFSSFKIDFQRACSILGRIAFFGCLCAFGLLFHVWYRQPNDPKLMAYCKFSNCYDYFI